MGYQQGKLFKLWILIGAMSFILLIVANCTAQPDSIKDPKICPTTNNEAPISKGGTPRLIVILIKEHPDYRQYAYKAFDILSSVLPRTLEPGDRVVILSMEQGDARSALIFDGEVDFIDKPPVLDPPVAPPTIGSLPPPSAEPQGGYMVSVATQDAIRYIEGTKTSATQEAFAYECAKEKWNQGNNEEWEKWNTKKQKAISKFMSEFSVAVEENKMHGFDKSASQLFEALQIASSVLNDECTNYAQCKLVIFSDFYDYRNFRPVEAEITLPKIEIAPMLLDCKFKSECEDKIIFWKEAFKSFGASDTSRFAINHEVEKALLIYLGR